MLNNENEIARKMLVGALLILEENKNDLYYSLKSL